MKKSEVVAIFNAQVDKMMNEFIHNLAGVSAQMKMEFAKSLGAPFTTSPVKNEVKKPVIQNKSISSKKTNNPINETTKPKQTNTLMVNGIPIVVDAAGFGDEVTSKSVLDDDRMTSMFNFERMQKLIK